MSYKILATLAEGFSIVALPLPKGMQHVSIISGLGKSISVRLLDLISPFQ